MKLRIIPILTLLVWCGSLSAQAGFVTTGVEASGSTGSISASVGQLMVGTDQAKATAAQRVTASLNEGLQQTYSVEELSGHLTTAPTASPSTPSTDECCRRVRSPT